MSAPWHRPIKVGPVFDRDAAVLDLRAALHEPLPFVVTQNKIAEFWAGALEGQSGMVTDETRTAIADALMCVAGQLAAATVLSGGAISAQGAANMLGLTGLHILDGDV